MRFNELLYDIDVREIKELVRRNGGEIVEDGQDSYGEHEKSFVVACYEDVERFSRIVKISIDDHVNVDKGWEPDPEVNDFGEDSPPRK